MTKLMYRRKISSQLLLTDEERKQIAENIIGFMRSCLQIQDYVSEPENQYQKRFKSYYYSFANRVFGSYWFRVYEKDGNFKELPDEKVLDDFMGMGGMFDRFAYHIRMNASLVHIDKLIEVLGNKVALHYLEYWAKKSMVIALILNKIVEEKRIGYP